MNSADAKLYGSLVLGDNDNGVPSLSITWLGTAGIHVHDGRNGILIDPYASRFPLSRIITGCRLRPDSSAIDGILGRVGPVSAIVISHSHFDHLVDAPLFAIRSGADLLGSESTTIVGRFEGVPEEKIFTCEHGTAVSYGGFTLEFIESLHGSSLLGSMLLDGHIGNDFRSPAPFTGYKTGKVFSILIKHHCGTLVHHGSAGFKPGMYDGRGCDILLLGIAQRGRTGPYLEQTAVPLCPRLIVPIHFDNFFRRDIDRISFLPRIRLKEFAETARKMVPSASVATLPAGLTVRIPC